MPPKVAEIARHLRKLNSNPLIALIGTAPLANPEKLPLYSAVRFSNIVEALSVVGENGSLSIALQGVSSQCKCPIVLVRIESAEKINTEIQRIISALNHYRRVLQPTLIGAPGIETTEFLLAIQAYAEPRHCQIYASSHDIALLLQWAKLINQPEVMLFYGDVYINLTDSEHLSKIPASAMALGIRADIDQHESWSYSLGSQVLKGNIAGLSEEIENKPLLNAHEQKKLTSSQINLLEFRNGYRFLSGYTTSLKYEYHLESYWRCAQKLHSMILSISKSCKKNELTAKTVRNLIDQIDTQLNEWKQNNILKNSRVWLQPDKNKVNVLPNKKLNLYCQYSPLSPIESPKSEDNFTFNIQITF